MKRGRRELDRLPVGLLGLPVSTTEHQEVSEVVVRLGVVGLLRDQIELRRQRLFEVRRSPGAGVTGQRDAEDAEDGGEDDADRGLVMDGQFFSFSASGRAAKGFRLELHLAVFDGDPELYLAAARLGTDRFGLALDVGAETLEVHLRVAPVDTLVQRSHRFVTSFLIIRKGWKNGKLCHMP